MPGGARGRDCRPTLREQFVVIGDDPVDFGHRREPGGIDPCRAAGHDQPRIGPRAARATDRGAGLLDRLVGDGAAVDDGHVAPGEQPADGFAFGDVEAAAQRHDLGCRRGRHGGRARDDERAKSTKQARDVLRFWFEETRRECTSRRTMRSTRRSASGSARCATRVRGEPARVGGTGRRERCWRAIILLDQFSRNVHRGSAGGVRRRCHAR